MATLRQPQIPGVSVSERPMTPADAKAFGAPPVPPDPFDQEVRQRAQSAATQRRAAMPGGLSGQKVVGTPGVAGGVGSAQPSVPGGSGPEVEGARKPGRLGGLRNAVAGAKQFVSGGSTNPASAFKSVGRGAASALRAGGKLISAHIAGAGIAGAADGLNTDTDTYRERLGLGRDDNPTFLGDLGVRAAGVATDVGNRVTLGGLRRVHGMMYGEDRWDGATPSAQGTGAQKTPPSPAGAGRGITPDPRMVGLTDAQRSDPGRFGASRDMTSELASVPRDLPSDLRQGVIHKTVDANGRPVYSGMNVGANARMVDGMGRDLPQRGGVATVQGMAPGEAQATLRRGGAGSPETPGASGSTQGLTASGGLFDTPKARRAAEGLRLQQRGQDLNYDATTRGQDLLLEGTMAGVRSRENLEKAKTNQTQMLRRATAQFMQEAGGDPARAAQLALRSGYTDVAESLRGGAADSDKLATGRREQLSELLKPISVTQDKDGNPVVNEAMVQQNLAALEGIASMQGVSVDELMADADASRAAVKLIQGINQRNQGWGVALGLDKPTLRRQLPNMKGAQTESAGIWDVLGPKAQWGDRRIVTGSGDLYIPEEVWADESVQNLVKARTGK